MIIKVPDPNYSNLYFDTELHAVKIIKPNTNPLQVHSDLWHPALPKHYIEKCLRQRIKTSNIVTRVVYYVITNDGKEGFIPVPRYCPPAFRQRKDTNPDIHFIYNVNNKGIFYFK